MEKIIVFYVDSPGGPNCPKCGKPFEYRLALPWAVRHLLGFLPLRRYYCVNCRKITYVRDR